MSLYIFFYILYFYYKGNQAQVYKAAMFKLLFVSRCIKLNI